MKNFLSGFPSIDKLQKEMQGVSSPDIREANGHIHTPYSFSAFTDLDSIFRMAVKRKLLFWGSMIFM